MVFVCICTSCNVSLFILPSYYAKFKLVSFMIQQRIINTLSESSESFGESNIDETICDRKMALERGEEAVSTDSLRGLPFTLEVVG